MAGKDGSIILDIDAGLPIGIETPVTALGSLLSGRFKASPRFGDIRTKESEGNLR
jgi:hypothetical protein